MPVIFTHTQSHTHTHSNHPHSPEHMHVKHNTQLYNIKLQQFILRANHVNFNQHATDNHNHAPLIHTASQQTDNTLSHHKTDCATSISAMHIQNTGLPHYRDASGNGEKNKYSLYHILFSLLILN